MPVYISLLRGINVGGHNKIKMAALRELYESLGFKSVSTLLQSGNAVFLTEESDSAAIATQIEAGIAESFGHDVTVIIRTLPEYQAAVEAVPFSEAEREDYKKILVMFLRDAPTEDAITALEEAYNGPGVIHVRGAQAYIHYVNGVGRSKLTPVLLEKHLGTPGTARNWRTVIRVQELAEMI